MRTRFWLTLLLAVGLCRVSAAQVIDPSPQTVNALDSGTACSVAGSCATWNISSAPSVTIQVAGTFSGTLTFEGTSNNLTWFTITVTNLNGATAATTTTSTGQFSVSNTGLMGVRTRMTSYSSGGALVSLTRGAASAKAGGGTTYTGTANQVIVTGSVLSTPQNTDTAAAFRVGTLGVGAALGTATVTLAGGATIAPSADSTTAEKFTKADGSTAVLTLDTTNNRLVVPVSGNSATSITAGSNDGIALNGGNFSFGIVVANSPVFIEDNSHNIRMSAGEIVGWSATANGAGVPSGNDVALARNQAGVVEVNNGTAGTFRDLAFRKVTTFNSITAAGLGLGGILGSYSTTGNTGAITNAINYTPPATAGGYGVRGLVDMTAWTTPSAGITVQCVYTDATGSSRTETLGLTRGTTGATATAVTAVDRWYFALPLFTIDNSATAITCSTTGTFTGSPVYNLAFILQQYQ